MIVRTERAIKYRAMSSMLRDAGYVLIGRPTLPSYRLLAILTIACNTIGEMMSVHPYRVFHALYVRLIQTTRGAKHDANQSKYVRAGEHQDWDDLHVWCPCCGADLLAAGPVGPSEIAEGMAKTAAMRGQSPQKSPHSADVEGENSHEIGKAVKGKGRSRGAGGTGGGDPAGAPLPSVPPHSPEP